MSGGVRRSGTIAASAAAAVVLAGCGTTEPEGPRPPVTIRAEIVDGAVEVDEVRTRVERGSEVTIEVTSDAAAEVHVHGYDRYIRLDDAGSGSTTFTAGLPGVFEVETHDSGLLLFQLEVR